ncbi:MAG TPA: PLP-dependent aminotransferase family protein [Drouetiella sp.]
MSFPVNIVLAVESNEPLFKQLARQLREAITTGKLPPGKPLPPTRRLADELGVSRFTVIESYRLLASQGLIEAGRGSGSRVAQNLATIPTDREHDAVADAQPASNVSSYAKRIASIGPLHEDNPYITSELNYGGIAADLLPIKTWRQMMSTYSRSLDSGIFDPWHDPLGFGPLRDALADYVSRTRGVSASPSQVAVFSGYQPAMECIARVLVDAGEVVAAENPGYIGASKTFEYQGAKILPIEADSSGMQVHQLGALETPPRVILTTPSLQEPTGVTMSNERRNWLLDYAHKNSLFIIEDDYDSEYRYGAKPVPSLHSMDKNGLVIFVGNFRKMLYPLIRLAFIVVPPNLVRYVELAKSSVERDLPIVEQCALNEFIASGNLEKHVQKTRGILNERRQTLVHELTVQFGKGVTLTRENSGTHIMVDFHTDMPDDQILDLAKDCHANLVSFSEYYLDNRETNGQFLWSYLSGSTEEIKKSVIALAQAMRGGV